LSQKPTTRLLLATSACSDADGALVLSDTDEVSIRIQVENAKKEKGVYSALPLTQLKVNTPPLLVTIFTG